VWYRRHGAVHSLGSARRAVRRRLNIA
jgi:hypothetical protein